VIREAKPRDIDAVTALGIEAIERHDPYKQLRIDKKAVKEAVIEVISGPQNFCWVDERDGVINGAVGGQVHDIAFYERKQLSVLMMYCRDVGSGGFLIRKMIRWFHTRPGIKACVFTLEAGVDERVARLLGKLGIQRELKSYIGVK
jgi:hypothetical protein